MMKMDLVEYDVIVLDSSVIQVFSPQNDNSIYNAESWDAWDAWDACDAWDAD